MIYIEQFLVTGVEVGTNLRVYAAGTLAFLAGIQVASVHPIHIGAGASEVAKIAFEIRHLNDLLYLVDDTPFRATGNKLPLMGGDGAEGTATKTASMDVDAELNHFVGRDAFAFVLGMGLTRVGQVEGGIQLVCRHWGVGRVDNNTGARWRTIGGGGRDKWLKQATGVHHVRLFLDMAEVLGL